MLRIIQGSSIGQAKWYYTQGLENGDYYMGQSPVELHGQWHGKAAEMLGLKDQQITKEAFFSLAENRHPETGKALTGRTKENRTVGYDFNFHAPKSLSLLYAITKDERIVDEFQQAVKATMHDIEQDMRTRVRVDDRNEERNTGNMVWADFTHFTSRPVDGTPDPHLHVHNYVFNATYDQAEQKWKAGQFRDIKRDAGYFEAAFHARLAKQIKDLGYGVRRVQGPAGWEIATVPQTAIEKFQRRTDQIESLAEELGIKNPGSKAKLGARTRESKGQDYDFEELRQVWKQRLTMDERDSINTAPTRKPLKPNIKPQQAIDYAVNHCLERHSVVPERQLQETALRHGVGSIGFNEFSKVWSKQDLILADVQETWSERRLATTREILIEEVEMTRFVQDTKGTRWPLGNKDFQFELIRDKDGNTYELNASQKRAVRHLLKSMDRVTAIRGAAGVGKTTLMQQAIRGLAENGLQTFTFAPSASASRGTLRKEGFANADTVARLLKDEELQEQVRNQVIWIDEAGLLGTRDLGRVFRIAKQQNTRVVLSGDTKQHAAVARGDAFRLLQDHGLQIAEVSEIVRQKPKAYRAAVADLSQGNIADGFEKLDQLGAIREVADEDRYLELASNYLEVTSVRKKNGKHKTALVVSPTHKEGEQVTEVIRNTLKEEGKIDQAEEQVLRLRNRQLTEAQKSDAINYQSGNVVQFHQHSEGIKKGQRAAVLHSEGGNVWVRKADGDIATLNLDHAGRFQVFDQSKLGIAAGDRIRITSYGKTVDGKHRFENGAMYDVKKITPNGDLQLNNNWIIGKNFGHLAHGFVTTSHASQGMSVDTVLIAQSSQSMGAASREQFYVSASRGKESVLVFTDDRKLLKESATRTQERLAAMELAAKETAMTPRQRLMKEYMERAQMLVVQAAIAAKQRSHAAYQSVGQWTQRAVEPLKPQPPKQVPSR